MTDEWRVLVVDDDPAVGETISKLLETNSTTVQFEQHFHRAVELVATNKFDILVLDIRDESSNTVSKGAGINIFHKIRERCFMPIIFYTALPGASADISNAPFIQTVSKIDDDPISAMRDAINNVIGSGLPRLLQSVSDHVANVEREFMADFVEQHWSHLVDRPEDVAYLLSRRLATSFEEGSESLALKLGRTGSTTPGDKIHPTRYYIQPPSSDFKMGDLLAKSGPVENVEDGTELYVVLTPSCDLVLRLGKMKADRVLLSQCIPLSYFKEYQDWENSVDNGNEKSLRKLIDSRPDRQEDRYFFLPAAWNLQDCVADLQDVVSIPCEELASYKKIALLDSPFAEALSYQFNRYMGRVGKPDLDVDGVLGRLKLSLGRTA